MTDKKKQILIYVLSFGIPFTMYLVIGVLLQLYPLSDRTILFSDMNEQLVSFYHGFKQMIITGDSYFYTFSKNLGGDMVGFSAYYLQNPFLFILFLFPYDNLPLGIWLMEIIMMSTASLTFQIFITKIFKKSNLIVSTAYGFMGEMLAYFSLPIYFCNVILLPIVMLGFYKMFYGVCNTCDGNIPTPQQADGESSIDKAIKDNKYSVRNSLIYIVSLALSIFCNYYLGYMLCIFLVLYFVYLCVVESENGRGNILFKFKTFVISSELGVMLSSFDLIPVALSLRNQKAAPSGSIFEFKRTFRLVDLYKTFLPGKFNTPFASQSLPYAYMGATVLAFTIILFISKRISLREKLASVGLVGVLIFCLWFKPLNTVWHAFNEPVGFPFRFSFYLSFVLLVLAYKGYIEAEEILKRQSWVGNLINRILSIGVFCVVLIELLYNTYFIMGYNVSMGKSHERFVEYYDRVNPIIDEIKSMEDADSLYRIEKDIQYNQEDSFAFDYAGLTHNSSCEKDYVKEFVGKMGLRNQGIWAFYNQGSTAFTDSFLGVKYLVSRFDSSEKPYSLIYNTDDTFALKNPYALPFAFIMDADKTRNIDISEFENNTDSAIDGNNQRNYGHTFEFQNDIAKAFGFDGDILTEANVIEIRVVGDTVSVGDKLTEHAKRNGIDIKGVALDEIDDENLKSCIEFDVLSEDAGKTLYMYFAAPHMQGARIYVNGMDWDDYFSDWRWAVEKAGNFLEGEIAAIRIECTGEELIVDDYQLYLEEPKMLAAWYDKALDNGCGSVNLKKDTNSHITGTYEANEDGLLVFSIPYEKGWHIKVDGKTVKQEEVLSALMAVETSKGSHTIDMKYIPEGLILGVMVSLIALLIINTMMLRDKKRNAK